MNRSAWIVLCVALGLVALGCSSRREVQGTSTSVVATTGAEAPAQGDPSDVHLEDDHITIDDHIRFAFDSDEILPESSTILDHLATFLQNHAAEVPTLHVIGHTDAQGNAAHNRDLSERRAAAVVRALQERGVTITLQPIGRGHTQRLCTENTEACHERNRRVELLVVR
jgi:OOP family OmpA-OmpF porin